MPIDYSFKILEALLMAKEYQDRDDVLLTAEVVVRVVCSFGNLAPAWTAGYKEALNKLKTLKFEEMEEIISILNSYEDDEEEADENEVSETDADLEEAIEECRDRTKDCGKAAYQRGMELYAKKEYARAVAYFQDAARQGNAKAEYNYALCLYNGIGVDMNRVEAIKHFTSASESGIAQADRMLRYIAYGK